MQDADLGFHLIIDRRKDRWASVKAVLLKISVNINFHIIDLKLIESKFIFSKF